MKLLEDLTKESVHGYYYGVGKKFPFCINIIPETYNYVWKDTAGSKFQYLSEVVDGEHFDMYKFDSKEEYEFFIKRKDLARKLMR